MKRFFLIPVLFLAFFVSSCEDDSKDPLPTQDPGLYMRLDIERYHRQLNLTDIENTYFGGMLTSPGGKVVRYELMVRRNETSPNPMDYVPLVTVNQFPYHLKITPAMLAEAIGVQVSDLKEGDFFRFYAYAYDANGKVATYRNLSPLNQSTPEMGQAFRYNTNLTSTPNGDNDEPYDNRNIN